VYTCSVAPQVGFGRSADRAGSGHKSSRGDSVGDKSPKAAEKKKKQSAAKKDAGAKKK
jgi:hypothetical protein